MTATFYDVLGVSSSATQADIRTAYRELVKQYHPDVSDHPNAAERFQTVVTAEEILGDPTERARYDRLGHESYRRVTGIDDPVDWPTVDEDRADDDEREPRESQSSASDAGRSVSTASGNSATESGASSTTGNSATTAGTDAGRTRSATGQAHTEWSQYVREPGTREQTRERKRAHERRRAASRQRRNRAYRAARVGGTEDVSAATRHERKRWQAASRRRKNGNFWSAEVDESLDSTPREGGVARKVRSRDAAILSTVLLVVYPVFVYFSVASSLSPALNILIGVATLVMAILSLIEPAVSLVVFGTWSVLSPFVLLFFNQPLLSLTAIVVLAAFWVPLILAGLVRLAMPH